MTTTSNKTTHREGTRWVESKPLEGALAMTTVPNTTAEGNALDDARRHLDHCKAQLEALDLALAVYRNDEAMRYIRKIEAEGRRVEDLTLDATVHYFFAMTDVFKLRHPKLVRFFGGAK